jgi:NAD(P)-dependent dehydrogenase (short-subunit alcohol dehydrogenase family)
MGYGNMAYGDYKWAAQGIMKNAAANLSKRDISLNAVAPGSTMTVLAYHMYRGKITEAATKEKNQMVRKNAALPVEQFQPEDNDPLITF